MKNNYETEFTSCQGKISQVLGSMVRLLIDHDMFDRTKLKAILPIYDVDVYVCAAKSMAAYDAIFQLATFFA